MSEILSVVYSILCSVLICPCLTLYLFDKYIKSHPESARVRVNFQGYEGQYHQIVFVIIQLVIVCSVVEQSDEVLEFNLILLKNLTRAVSLSKTWFLMINATTRVYDRYSPRPNHRCQMVYPLKFSSKSRMGSMDGPS